MLDAAEALIRERGFDDMTIAEVVQRSDTSVGSLYGRFRSKRGLLQAVQVRYHTRVESAIAAEFSDQNEDGCLMEAVQRIVHRLSHHLLGEPELFRAFFVEAVLDPAVRAQGERASGRRRDTISEVLLAHRGEIRHPDPDMAARWFYTMCMAILRERITFGPEAPLSGGFPDETVISELTRAATNYLMGGGAPGAAGLTGATRKEV